MKSVFLVLMLFGSLHTLAGQTTTVKEAEISKCVKDSECLVVPYSHCCGSSKRAINKKFLNEYNKTPAWQKFNDPQSCAVIGQCISDEKVKTAKCEAGQCQLRFP